MEKIKGKFFCVSLIIWLFGVSCQQQKSTPVTTALPKLHKDPFTESFWNRKIAYVKRIGLSTDTIFFDAIGNIVKEVSFGKVMLRREFDQNHYLLREWNANDHENVTYSYDTSSSLIIQRVEYLATPEWNNQSSLKRRSEDYIIFKLDQSGNILREVNLKADVVVDYLYEDSNLVERRFHGLGTPIELVLEKYQYKGKELYRIQKFLYAEKEPRFIYYYSSGLLDSTREFSLDGKVIETLKYKYSFID
jgi:hypothetical protein